MIRCTDCRAWWKAYGRDLDVDTRPLSRADAEYVTVVDQVYPMAAVARLAARNDGWRPHPNDRDLYMRGARRIRLTQVGRDWCWTETSFTTEQQQPGATP